MPYRKREHISTFSTVYLSLKYLKTQMYSTEVNKDLVHLMFIRVLKMCSVFTLNFSSVSVNVWRVFTVESNFTRPMT